MAFLEFNNCDFYHPRSHFKIWLTAWCLCHSICTQPVHWDLECDPKYIHICPVLFLQRGPLQHRLQPWFQGCSFCRTDHGDIMKAVLLQDTLAHQACFLFTAKRSLSQTHTDKTQKHWSAHTHTHKTNLQKKLSTCRRTKLCTQTNKNRPGRPLFLSCSSSCPILASLHKHHRGWEKIKGFLTMKHMHGKHNIND